MQPAAGADLIEPVRAERGCRAAREFQFLPVSLPDKSAFWLKGIPVCFWKDGRARQR